MIVAAITAIPTNLTEVFMTSPMTLLCGEAHSHGELIDLKIQGVDRGHHGILLQFAGTVGAGGAGGGTA
jgi:hypothetical protein